MNREERREHLHRYFLAREVSEVVSDLQSAGCAVDYTPGQCRDGSPKSAIFRHGVIGDCRSWKDPPLVIPAGAKSCAELSSNDQKTNELVQKLYQLNLSCVHCCTSN